MESMGTDPQLFKVLPGILELERMDHIVHILLWDSVYHRGCDDEERRIDSGQPSNILEAISFTSFAQQGAVMPEGSTAGLNSTISAPTTRP